jgi:hypothetical protein
MTNEEYWAEVSSLCDDFAEEMENYDRDDWMQYVHETLDGHSFCIYTDESQDVMRHSVNSGRAAEDFGGDAVVQDGQMNWGMMAFCALEADVYEEMHSRDIDINDDDEFGERFECAKCEERFTEANMDLLQSSGDHISLCYDCNDAVEEDAPVVAVDGVCPECQGTGVYVGFNSTEPCKTCGDK